MCMSTEDNAEETNTLMVARITNLIMVLLLMLVMLIRAISLITLIMLLTFGEITLLQMATVCPE